jgi:outer membrane protein TolC
VRSLSIGGVVALTLTLVLLAPRVASAEVRLSAAEALRRARAAAPELRVAREREGIARAEVGVAGVYPNPSVAAGTSTQTAQLSVTLSVPLVVLGQRGASIAASKADLETVKVEQEVTWADVRAGTARAFVALWLAQERSIARKEEVAIARRLDEVVTSRVEVGASPAVDGLRTRAERLRAEADAREAEELVDAAAAQLAFFVGTNETVRADGEYVVPEAPSLATLLARLDTNPSVRRESADARAADARTDRERALVRPVPVVDVGADFGDPTLRTTNYRAQLALEVPIFTQRGGQIERERAAAATARTRADLERGRARASLESAYHAFLGADARAKTLRFGVVSAADEAARATEESYTLGRAQLVAVLDAARTRLDARLALAEAVAARSNAWIDISRSIGEP